MLYLISMRNIHNTNQMEARMAKNKLTDIQKAVISTQNELIEKWSQRKFDKWVDKNYSSKLTDIQYIKLMDKELD